MERVGGCVICACGSGRRIASEPKRGTAKGVIKRGTDQGSRLCRGRTCYESSLVASSIRVPVRVFRS
jgi:hypothetical protein